MQWFKRSKSRPSLTGLTLNVQQNWLEKNQSTEKEATNKKPKLKILPIFQLIMTEVSLTLTFNQFHFHFPAARQVTYPPRQ